MSAPADAARVADCLGVERTPPVRSVIAATRSPFRIRPVPEIPSSWASRCRSETSNLERSPPLRPDDRGDAAAGCPMGGSSDAGAAPLRSSVVSLTNGPSIMILGRLGVFSTRVPWRQARSHCSRDPHLLMMKVAAALGIYSRTSRLSVCATRLRSRRREDVLWSSAQENVSLSWGDAKSPIPGQVYVTPQATSG